MLPALTLTAAVSGREITLNATACPTVLVFHGQDTAATALAVNTAIRAVHPDPATVLVASVIDLRAFPSMLHGLVRAELDKAYHKAAARLPAGSAAEDLVVLLPDWKGRAHEACGLRDTTRHAAVIVADPTGRILARDQSEDPAAAALAALAGA